MQQLIHESYTNMLSSSSLLAVNRFWTVSFTCDNELSPLTALFSPLMPHWSATKNYVILCIPNCHTQPERGITVVFR